ncbi:hypothetical protein Vadar_032842 [Vaccinium darrowii]|uniref:Uncharacterized protein n=1 Tax=Vaccinium darrowii TaxID=229202 RepID=A0ACB7X5Q2_9ERIC|nr:hypothetical protein Vadar_032842 [Vaccinium darrowii]
MGKKLDALLGRRHLNTSKLKALIKLGVSRLAVLKNQRRARCSLARSDVVQLLNLGHHDRALLRVEQVIKEQNALDVFVMLEGYFHLLVERINLIQQERACPEELKEVVSSLVYAATRCGEFPELQEMRAVFTSRFGKEFVSCAIDLRNNCGVNPKMIQKLSTTPPSLENKMKVLKEIASEEKIVLQNEGDSLAATEEKFEIEQKQNHPESTGISDGSKLCDDYHTNLQNEVEDVDLSDSMKATRKYKDVADAAEDAFISAAYAAAAARAAVELSRSESHDPDEHNSPGPVFDKNNSMKIKFQNTKENHLKRIEDQNGVLGFEKVHPIQNYHSESEDEILCEAKDKDSKEGRSVAHSRPSEGIVFDESDEETRSKQGGVAISRTRDKYVDIKHSAAMNEGLGSGKGDTIQYEGPSEKDSATFPRSQKRFPLRSQAGLKTESAIGNTNAHSSEVSRVLSGYNLNAGNKPVSVRTRRVQGR